jgi:hypothetical protein
MDWSSPIAKNPVESRRTRSGPSIAICNQYFEVACAPHVFLRGKFFTSHENIGFSGGLRPGTPVAKMVATSYRRDNKRQLPQQGRNCLYSGLFLFVTRRWRFP